MSQLNIFVSKKTKVRCKNQQLCLVQENKQYEYPLEDINFLMIEDRRSNLSSYVLTELITHSVCTMFCDEKHLPCGVLLPLHQHTKEKEGLILQLKLGQATKKKLWKQIVYQKVFNQAKCLEYFNLPEHKELKYLLQTIKSGDTTNVEGFAASIYFKSLFGQKFKRSIASPINSCLNYGYSLIRANLARLVCSYGLNPVLGIFHCNQYNNFVLVDDIIEPFRPIVDAVVKKINPDRLDTNIKKDIFRVLSVETVVDLKRYSLSYAQELVVKDYKTQLLNNGFQLKMLPFFCGIKEHIII